MPTILRKLGVHGKNGPTIQQRRVTASDFSIIGLVGQFERKYDKAFEVSDPDELQVIFGGNFNSNYYGYDVMKTFFNNLAGSEATSYIKSHVGFDGSSIDAVVASSLVTDQNGLPSLLLLLNDLITAYDTHDADAELAAAWSYHAAQEASDHSLLTGSTQVTTLDEAITKINDLKSKYNAHDADGSAHGVASSHQESTADATNMATAIALVNSLKTVQNAHAADAAQHTGGVDNVNYPVSTTNASGTPANTLKIEAGYKAGSASGALEYGISGNRTGYKVVGGIRYTTQLAATVAAVATSATLDSVVGIQIGDLVVFNASGGTGAIITKKVTAVDQNANTISWSGAFHGSVTGAINDDVNVPGFKIETYRKSLEGIVSEVETDLGDLWCTLESEVTQYYVENVHQNNKYIKVSDQSSASTTIETFPNEIPSVTLLTSGADGTSPTTSAHWSRDLTKLNDLPVRLIANPETTSRSIQKAGEIYCSGRDDTPIWVATLAEDQDEDQLKIIGSDYQRGGNVFQVNVAEWIGIDDDFNTAPNSPDRYVPNVGALMGVWIRSIATLGIHYIPCTEDVPIVGINSLSNSSLGENVSDRVRTELSEYGINIIQFVQGSGFRIRNLFTPSTDTATQFANGIIMRNFFKVSAEDSLQASENTPNSFNRINEDKQALRKFFYQIWFRGSTGSVPVGESFGQQQNADGSLTQPEDHFNIKADAINNPQSSINAGERNLSVSFSYPTPSGSIDIEVGILLRS